MRTARLAFAPASERNKGPILDVLTRVCRRPGRVLELGSGTGQHAVHFAGQLPQLIWQPTELPAGLPDLSVRCSTCGVPNLLPPIALDVLAAQWPEEGFEYVVCINVLHIVSWPAVEAIFRGAGQSLVGGGAFYVYGPFRYADRELEPSNAQFDRALRHRDPESGLREVGALEELAGRNGMQQELDRAMPANNRSLLWRKR